MRFFILVFLLSSAAFSQIKQVNGDEIQTDSATVPQKPFHTVQIGLITAMAEPLIECLKKEDTYTFKYQNHKNSKNRKIHSFSFKDIDNAFDNLYQLIMDGFDNPNLNDKNNVMLELPDDIIWLDYKKSVGLVSFRFKHAVQNDTKKINMSAWITKDKVRKLFGKD